MNGWTMNDEQALKKLLDKKNKVNDKYDQDLKELASSVPLPNSYIVKDFLKSNSQKVLDVLIKHFDPSPQVIPPGTTISEHPTHGRMLVVAYPPNALGEQTYGPLKPISNKLHSVGVDDNGAYSFITSKPLGMNAIQTAEFEEALRIRIKFSDFGINLLPATVKRLQDFEKYLDILASDANGAMLDMRTVRDIFTSSFPDTVNI